MSRSLSAARAGLDSAAPVFAALGDATRLKLVLRLCNDGPLSIARLSDDVDVSRQAVTKHLRAMGDAGLVRPTRRGREQIWTLDPNRLDEARQCLDRIAGHWDATIERLRAFVERDR